MFGVREPCPNTLTNFLRKSLIAASASCIVSSVTYLQMHRERMDESSGSEFQHPFKYHKFFLKTIF